MPSILNKYQTLLNILKDYLHQITIAKDGTDYFGGRVESITYEKDEEEAKFRANINLTVTIFEAA